MILFISGEKNVAAKILDANEANSCSDIWLRPLPDSCCWFQVGVQIGSP
jgi:hypothetical protein